MTADSTIPASASGSTPRVGVGRLLHRWLASWCMFMGTMYLVGVPRNWSRIAVLAAGALLITLMSRSRGPLVR